MPAEVDKLHDELVKDSSFKKSYEKLVKTKKGFKKQFSTLDDYAWAVANKRYSEKSAASDDDLPGYLYLESAAKVEDPQKYGHLFSDERVKNFLDTGGPGDVNCSIVITELVPLETPSQHNAGKLHFILSAEGAEETWSKLNGSPVHWTATASGHGSMRKPTSIGTVIEATVDRSREYPLVMAALQLWDRDFPDEVGFIKEIVDHLGASYEITLGAGSVEERDENEYYVKGYVPVGMALLRRTHAAYPEMRVLAASADGIDAGQFSEIDETEIRIGSDDPADPGSDHPGNGDPRDAGTSDDDALDAAVWTTKYVNDLPDSAFALVRKPVEDKARDRALPYKDKGGKVDPAHVRNALARLSQAKGWSDEEKARAKAKLQKSLKSIGGKPAGQDKKGSAMSVSTKVDALMLQVPEESAELVKAILAAQTEESEAKAETAEVLADRDANIGELKAQMDALKKNVEEVQSENTQLKSEKDEAERLQRIAEQKQKAEDEFATLVAKKAYDEKDRKEIVQILCKLSAGENLTPEEARKFAELRLGKGEQDDLPPDDTPSADGGDDKWDADKATDEAASALHAQGKLAMPGFKKEGGS